MSSLITRFQITGLFGYRDVDLNFANPYKILIGENGLGKTTVLNCFPISLMVYLKILQQMISSVCCVDISKNKSTPLQGMYIINRFNWRGEVHISHINKGSIM